MATFTGTAGDDKLKGTTDADTLVGLAGNDTYTVDHTDDVVTEAPGEGTDTISTSVTYNLSDEVENLILTGTTSLDAKANDLSNSITGNSGGNHLYTLDGVDTVVAGLGDDTIEAGAFLAADDRLDGGAGVDRLRLDGDYSGGLTLGAATVVNFERISLADGNSYDITLDDATNGSSLLVKGNRLTTGTLNLDGSAETKFSLTAFGGDLDDTLIGGAGADTLRGGGGADIVTGGAGIDTASYASSKAGVTVDLTNNLNNAGGDAAGDTLTGIENLTGSDLDDSLTGDKGANILDGGSGDDTLTAGAGDDKILGGGGLDVLVLDTNLTTADTVDGGDDYDVLQIGGDFSAGFTLGTKVLNIEEVDLADGNSYKFTLTAAANNSTLLIDGTALTGANRVIVNGAAETIHSLTAFGGEGNDSLVGGSAADTLGGGIDGNDTVLGGSGDDFINQGSGLSALDRIDGGAGKDTLFLSGDYSGGVTFSTTTVTGVETILLDGGFGYDLTLNNGTNAAALIVDGQTNNAGPMVINGAAETSNAFTLLGGDSDDKLIAGGGADLLIGGAGADTLTGGGGLLDTASYAASAGGVNVNLTTGTGTGNDAQGDVLSGIEHVIGTDFDDSLTGSSAANKLIGGFGNDTLAGGTSGNDLLDGGEDDDTFVMGAGMTAADTLIGGNSNDTLQLDGNYAGGLTFGAKTATSIEAIQLAAGNSYKLTLNDETAGLTLNVNGAALGAGNFLQFNGAAEKSSSLTVTGGAGNDVLTGGAGDDKLTGNGGNDALNGGEGDDTLDGGAGNDKLTAGNGVNSLVGGIGLDTLIGGADSDIIAGGADNDSISGGAGTNNMKGEAGNDTIIGGAGTDTLDGGLDNDSLSGGGGTNLFDGGAGADTIVGGAGIDTATYAGSAFAVTVDLTSTKAQVSTGDASGDVLTGVENVIGSAQNDTLIGSTGNNSLQGAGGFDKLTGGLGNDTLDGGAISDVLDGGAGIDLAGYASSGKAVTIDLALAIQVSGGDATGDQYFNIEGVVGSNFDDTLTGNTGTNSIDGGAGDDQIVMGANLTAADSIDGGADIDTLVLDGNYAAGLSFAATTMKNVEFVSLTGGNNYKLTLADANNTDTLTVDGSALGANTLYLTASAETKNSLIATGADGNDTLTGGGGSDTLTGGAGADKLTGGGGGDTADYSFSTDAVTVDLTSTKAQVSTGDASGDILAGIENLAGSIFNDWLKGNTGANSLVGGDGDDTMIGGAGADTLDGGGNLDNDTADYSAGTAAIALNLGDGTGSAGDAKGDVLTGIETVIGSKFNDSFIEGGEIHTLQGGLGNDLVDYSFSTDAIQVDLASGAPNAGGFADQDVLLEVESVIGTAKDDSIIGSDASNRLVGGEGADTLDAGSDGIDTLQGGKGQDYITVSGTLTAKDQIDGGTDDPKNLSAEHDKLDISGDYSAGVTFTATTVQNIEEIILGDGFNYVFTANNATNAGKLTIDASALTAGSSLNFNAGAETSHSYVFLTGADADTITGGAGKDTLDFSKATSAATANLTDSSLNSGFAAGDVYAKIDNILGSIYDDVLTGDKGNNILEGGLGDDIISGGAGNDTLAGGINLLGADTDRVVGDDGFDVFDGGDGIDSITFDGASNAVTVDLLNGIGDGAALGDIYSNIENVIGTDFDDLIIGDTGNNRIEGGKGFDTLSGDLGADTLIGGAKADVFAETFFTSKDRVEGGDEVDDPDTDLEFEGDTLQLNGDFSAGLTFTAAMAKGIEKIEVIGGFSYVLTLNNATNTSTMIVDASSLGQFDVFKFNGAQETSNSFTIFGGLGDDTIVGGAASDVIVGNFGADSLVGGNGSDTAGYQNSFEAVTVDLNLKTAQLGTGGDDATGDILVSIENLRGTDYDDTLIGDKNGNILEGGKGNDTLNGGLGLDVASYAHDDTAVQINLLDPTKNTGAAAGDVYSSIEGAIGTQKDDTIIGNGSANYIDGGKGDDTLVSGHGNDTVLGGDGKDRIELGFSLNALDKIDGGDDDDTVVLDGNYSTNVTLGATTLTNVETILLTAGNNYRFTLNDGNNTNGLTIDGSALQEEEVLVINGAAEKTAQLEIIGGADNDSLTGGGGDDKFKGGTGNDLLVGNAGDDNLDGEDGNDSITGGVGADAISGGAGIDTMLGGADGDQFLMKGNLTASDRIDGGTETDTLVLDGDYSKGLVFGALTMLNVEVIQLTAGNDYKLVMDKVTNGSTLTLDASGLGSGDNVDFNGSLEDKNTFVVTSGAGDDLIIVGAGNDTVDGGAGADTLNGGAGIDTVSYLRSASGVTVDLTDNSNNAGGDAAGDVLSNFENIVGSALDDSLTGNSLANLIIGGAGGDFIDGGLGVDTVTYIDSKFVVGVDLNKGVGYGIFSDADGDTFVNIENVIGTDIAVDKDGNHVGDELIGNDANNLLDGLQGWDDLIGLGGNDTLLGGFGNDYLEGGKGADSIDGGGGDDWVSYIDSFAAVTVDLRITTKGQTSGGEANGDIITGVENIRGSDFNDRLTGDNLGNDFEGGKGADTMDGGGGANASNYFDSDAAVQVSLVIVGAQNSTGDADGDVLININNLRGSAFNDKLTGDNLGNGFFGWFGNDTITGGGGRDMFEFNSDGEGVDLITDFTIGKDFQGDFLQICDVLDDATFEVARVNEFARLVQKIGNAEFQVNADGVGDDWVTIAVLQGVNGFGMTAQDMLDNGNLQVVGE